MKKSRFSAEQMIGILKEHQAGLGAKALCRRHGISDATFYKWRSKYGGMEVSDARRLKTLEDENAKLKTMASTNTCSRRCAMLAMWLQRGAPTTISSGLTGEQVSSTSFSRNNSRSFPQYA